MRLLVTGGAGFIGSNFIKYMLKKYPEYKIINLDALTYAGSVNNLDDIKENPNYKFIKANICDKKAVNEIISEVDCVINIAAETHVDNSIKNPSLFIQSNVLGTLNLLEASMKSNITRFIQISTDEVYGSLGNDGYFCETSPLKPNNPYSVSKASADMLVSAYHKTYKLPAVITRCSNNYGPYQYPEKLIPYFITQLLKGKKVPLYGDGLNVRDWLYVSDHCEAIDLALHKGKIGEIYNIGAHNEKTNLEITRIILNTLGFDESMIEYIKDRPGHDKRYAMSNEKITKELGWCPKMPFEKGIAHTIDWYLNNRNLL